MRAMFLDSLIESAQHEQPVRRWPTVVSFALQTAGIAVLVLLPLFYTGALPAVHPDPPVLRFAKHADPDHVKVITVHEAQTQTGQLVEPRVIPPAIYRPAEPEVAPPDVNEIVVEGPVDNPALPGGNKRGKVIAELLKPVPVQPTLPPPKRMVVSTGVIEGLLLHRVAPQYPRVALLARVEGNVVLTAVISTEGKVEQLQVQSGPPLLIAAAIDAVRQWRYRPYMLNDKPTEVSAQITVAFHLEK